MQSKYVNKMKLYNCFCTWSHGKVDEYCLSIWVPYGNNTLWGNSGQP